MNNKTTDMNKKKKFSIVELEDMLDWMNEIAFFFNDGYAEYVMKKYKKSDKDVSLIALTCVLFGHPNGTENREEETEHKYSMLLYEYGKKNIERILDDFLLFEENLNLRQYKKVMRYLMVEFCRDACSKTENQHLVNNKYRIYSQVFDNLDL